VALHATWRATGDRSLIEKHLRTAEGCLAWIDSYGDRDRTRRAPRLDTRSPTTLPETGLPPAEARQLCLAPSEGWVSDITGRDLIGQRRRWIVDFSRWLTRFSGSAG
jgi:hypothetical protein